MTLLTREAIYDSQRPSIRDRCRELHGAKACQAGLGLMHIRGVVRTAICRHGALAVKYAMSLTGQGRNPLFDRYQNFDAYGS